MDTLVEGVHEYRNSFLHVVIDDGARLLYSEWTRQPTRAEYRQAAGIFAAFLNENGILYWIQDTSVLQEIAATDMRWVLEELIPLADKSCLKKIARITCNKANIELFKEMVRIAKAEYKLSIEVRQFKSYREAAEWVEGISDADE
ncbi:hypothetical protein FVR03_22945 [Pontibacter qinzhouensis]|uniref:STAS/SEC14 domain-containing protein n=2 Tax=Pontibacter qinzhouensis TaxID=2603253 RepID=A0A5C8IN13_9BACT|nr:hypothetical protein FVR03_22945 [Pontibacter qinzhouensis]